MYRIKDSHVVLLLLLILIGCHHSKTLPAPINIQMAYITMDNTQVLFRGYDSHFEYDASCPAGYQSYLSVEGGTIRTNPSEKASVNILKADSTSNEVILKLYCTSTTDSLLLVTKTYPVKDIPHPNIYYGGINLTDYSIYEDTVLFNPSGISANYAHVPGLIHTTAAIYDCSYTFRGSDYRLNGIRKTFHASILNDIKIGETIYFNSIKYRDVSGNSTTLYLKREITKASAVNENLFILK